MDDRLNKVFFGYLLISCLILTISGCCGDQPPLNKGQINVNLVNETRKGYFSLANLQTPLPSAQPLTMAASDWNQDGTVDLISSYASDMGGLLMLQQGAVNFRHPKSKEMLSESPFDSTAEVIEVPLRPDFVFTGDFNHDHLQDILIAQKDASYLYWIAGDGQQFSAGNLIPLPGTITAITVGALDRDIGSKDTIIALQTNDTFQLLIYKGRQKEAFSQPEVYPFDNRIDALEVGLLNQDAGNDLAILSGNKLWAVMGNPNLTYASERKPTPIRFRFPVKRFAFGNFKPESRNGLALLSESGKIHSLTFDHESHWHKKVIAKGAWPESSQLLRTRMTGNPLDDLAIITGNQVQLLATTKAGRVYESVDSFELPGDFASAISLRLNYDALYDLVFLENHNPITIALTQPQSTLRVNLLSDENDANTGDGLCDIDLGTPGDQCTFRAAIQEANASAGVDNIDFQIVDPTIAPINPLPAITDPVNINPFEFEIVELSGTNPNASISSALTISAGSSTLKGLVINDFDGSATAAGINLLINGSNVIYDCFIGTDRTGTIAHGNGYGILINSSSNNAIGGLTDSNVISGNTFGISIQGNSAGNNLDENFIGTTADGSAALGNLGDGIYISSSAGGINHVTNSTISGNEGNGIRILSDGLITYNKIGVDPTGNTDIGNALIGISSILNSNFMENNIVSGNGSVGISVLGDDNFIENSFIGTNGTLPLGNDGGGILIQDGNHNRITTNTIAFNNGFQNPGIRVTGNSSENWFDRNVIYSNSGLGINLGNDEVTPNDPGDGDNGPNHLQNFPIITSATSNGDNLGITGTFNSSPNELFTLDFFGEPDCDQSGNGEGQIPLGDLNVHTDGNGDATFSSTFSYHVPVGYFVTATASHSISGDPLYYETSEFSACVQVESPASGNDCDIYPFPGYTLLIGQEAYATAILHDENGVPVPNVPVLFHIQTPYGENFEGAITDENGFAETPAFSSNGPADYTISMEGTGFSCSTTVSFNLCFDNPGFDVFSLTEYAQELLKIRIADPALDQFTMLLDRDLRPRLNEYLRTGSIKLTPAQRDSAISLLGLYIQKASPSLKQKLLEIRSRLQH